jgi:hypothetical protein
VSQYDEPDHIELVHSDAICERHTSSISVVEMLSLADRLSKLWTAESDLGRLHCATNSTVRGRKGA